VKIDDVAIKAEIADTDEKRLRGLMFRESLPESEGMLFVFDKEDYYGFWMMNMSFPIDIIWISANHTVVHIEKNVQPCKVSCPFYTPNEKALYVLEVSGNFTEKHGIKLGSVTQFAI